MADLCYLEDTVQYYVGRLTRADILLIECSHHRVVLQADYR
jgi:hypothetical protein